MKFKIGDEIEVIAGNNKGCKGIILKQIGMYYSLNINGVEVNCAVTSLKLIKENNTKLGLTLDLDGLTKEQMEQVIALQKKFVEENKVPEVTESGFIIDDKNNSMYFSITGMDLNNIARFKDEKLRAKFIEKLIALRNIEVWKAKNDRIYKTRDFYSCWIFMDKDLKPHFYQTSVPFPLQVYFSSELKARTAYNECKKYFEILYS